VLERNAGCFVTLCCVLLGSGPGCGDAQTPEGGTGAGSTGAGSTETGSTGDLATSADASSDSTGSAVDDTGTTAAEPFEGRLVVTADWLGRSLSLLDYDALVAGATTRDEMLVGTIDLSAWAPGPLELEITPDGRLAVVSISPGFFDGFVGNAIGAGDPESDGTLLVVDLEAREVVAELVGDSQPEADAPVKTMRQTAASLTVSAELEADVDADLTALLEGDAPAEQHRARFEEALRAQVAAVLEDHDVAELVELAIEGARVELNGRVPDVLTLQLVEDLAWSVPAVRECDNRLRIAG